MDGLDSDNNAGLLVLLLDWIDIAIKVMLASARVALGQSIGMCFCSNECYLGDVTPDLDPSIGMQGIDDKHAHARIASHVPTLLAFQGCVNQYMLIVAVHPHH